MKKLLYIFFILLFSFCSKKESPYPRLIVSEQKDVIEVNSKEMLQSNIVGLAYGIDKDTVINEVKEFSGSKDDFGYFANSDTIFPRYNFKIILDTSYTIPAKNFEYKNFDFPRKENMIVDGLINGKEPTQKQIAKQYKDIDLYYGNKTKLWNDYVTCLPLLILNNEKITAYIKETRMIQEAKDKDGIWKPIEFYDPLRGCIVSHHFFKFKPKKYNGYAIIKYSGDFKTKLRVKIQINNHYYYSNEFDGSINRSQFSHDYLKKYIDYHKDNYDEGGYKAKYEKYTLLQYDF